MSRNTATGLVVKRMTERPGRLFIALAIVATVSGVMSATEGLTPAAWADEPSVPQLASASRRRNHGSRIDDRRRGRQIVWSASKIDHRER